MLLNETKPDLDELVHFGVKGMKWGVRKASRPSASEVYRARDKTFNQKLDIKRQKKAVKSAKRPATKAKREAKLSEMKMNLLKNPDRAVAQRITKGDLAVTGLLGLVMPVSLPAFATATTLGLGAGVAKRKTIERRQKKGSYDKK